MFNYTFRDPAWISAIAGAELPDPLDTMESYVDNDEVDSLNGGTDWLASYVSRGGAQPAGDDMESYTDTADLDGLNGGTRFIAAYVSH